VIHMLDQPLAGDEIIIQVSEDEGKMMKNPVN
jgi:hypothetical protein